MFEVFRGNCRTVANERIPMTSSHLEENATIKMKSSTCRKKFLKFVKEDPHELESCVQLVMMAICSSFHAVLKYRPIFTVSCTPLKLSIDILFDKPNPKHQTAPISFNFCTKSEMHKQID